MAQPRLLVLLSSRTALDQVITELLSQPVLLNLSRRAPWNRADEDHVIRRPPLGDLSLGSSAWFAM